MRQQTSLQIIEWGKKWVFPLTAKEFFYQWLPPFKGCFFKKVWCAIYFIILWTIWRERNARLFESKVYSIDSIKDLILFRLSWWIKRWGDPFPYNSNEILRNPSCLRWDSHTKPRSQTVSLVSPDQWCPPPLGSLKWNVDASSKPSSSSSAIGGVLRDHSGNFVCIFSRPVPFMDINQAEILAIHRALQITSTNSRFSESPIIVESDSSNAVKWCNNPEGGPWNLAFIINFIRDAMSKEPRVSIIHKGRGTNTVADSMAKKGLTRADEFIAWIH